MQLVEKIEHNIVFRALLNVEKTIMIITSIVTACVIFAGVAMRYVFKANFFGQEEILCVVAMWLYWVGGIYGSYEGSHIKGDMLASLFKTARAKKTIELIIQGISFMVIFVFCIWGIEYMQFNLRFHAVSTGLKIPMAYSQMPILVGFILMELYTAFNFIRVLLDKDYGKPLKMSGKEGN